MIAVCMHITVELQMLSSFYTNVIIFFYILRSSNTFQQLKKIYIFIYFNNKLGN